MLAELHYTNTLVATIALDIAAVLTGATDLSQLSASVSQENSSMVGNPGTWVAETSNATATDVTAFTFGSVMATRAFSQPCAYNSAKTKYLKIAMGSVGGALANMRFAANIAPSMSTGALTLTNHSIRANNNYSTNGVLSGSTATGLTVSIFTSPNLTAISVGGNGLSLITAAIILDFPEDFLNGASSSNFLPAAICIPYASHIATFRLPMFTYNGVQFGHASSLTTNEIRVSFGNMVPPLILNLFTDNNFKFAGFLKNGTYYDLWPLAFTGLNCIQQTPASGNSYLTHTAPMDVFAQSHGIWAINSNAFGNTGDTFTTPEGTLVKFDNYMIKVR